MAYEPATGRLLDRLARRADAFMVPKPMPDEPGRFIVDGTWGTINPIELAPGVRTVGELEVTAQIENRLPLIDSRPHQSFASGTVPGARNVPHTETARRLAEFDPGVVTVLFCNGPQCAATPDAIRALLAAGYPAEQLRYYRGGMHDWLTLGLPTTPNPALSDRPSVSHEGERAQGSSA